jgi:uncharacterized membrane protein HdeD (DUF308 family)
MSVPVNTLPRERLAEAISSLWWLPLIRGILLLALGGYALFLPGMTAIMLTQIVGIFLIAEGILAVTAGIFAATSSRGWTIFRGALVILIGIFVLGHSAFVAGVTATVALYVIAFGVIASGVFEIMAAIRDRKQIEGEGWLLLSGGLAVLFGVLLLISPIAFGLFIVRVLGAYAILYGISLIAFAFRVRSLGKKGRQT